MAHIHHCPGLLITFAIGIWGLVSIGQEPPKKASPRGRLPAHYKDLVSPDQREEIYAIQGKYNEKIKQLEAEIEKLKRERDSQVERVLTPQQQARLKLLLDAKGKVAGQVEAKKDPPDNQNADRAEKKDVFPK